MTDVAALARIDSFPYRHRLNEVMSTPVLTALESLPLDEAINRMYRAKVSSIVGVDREGKAIGILTERDLLRILSTEGGAGLATTLGKAMSRPVTTVSGDSFLHVALGRMVRRGYRHLIVVDENDRPTGMVTGRALLKVRADDALVIGDEVHEASGPEEMRDALDMLPTLARRLLAEDVSACNIAAVIALVIRDLTARAAELAEQSMVEGGWGTPPAPYAVLVLGSAGRGESLLAFDQDNAIVHTGSWAYDQWYAELGRRMNSMLNEAGIPLCQGGVMAGNRPWRKNLPEWKDAIHSWVFSSDDKAVLACDIFYDFQPVWGDRSLADELRGHAMDKAAQSAFFLSYLSRHITEMDGALGLFGRLRTENGRLDAKKFGLLPLVSAARMRAIRAGIPATGTDERYAALAEQNLLHEDDLRDFAEIREVMLKTILEQQLADAEMGLPLSTRIDPKRLPRHTRSRLRWAFKRLGTLKSAVQAG